jgi:nitroimidazol reductase NimA-like FMN-containing flavoprotein (pyridoxamine 5'-phosphate oxidase superfamily)
MDDLNNPVSALTAEESWAKLRTQSLGRLVTRVGDVVDIFPVTYVVDGETLVFRTAEGSKLVELVVNDSVLFEVDELSAEDAWSVVVRGRARRLESPEEVAAADELPLTPAIPTLKHNYVRVEADSLSGRAFQRGDEPDRYGVQPY